jgi:hypothetical protein
VQKLHANARKKAHIRYDSSDDLADDLVDDLADDFVDNFVDDFANDFVDDFADDFVDDLVYFVHFVHFVHFVNENNVFSTSFEALLVRKALFKVLISIRKRTSAKKKISSSSKIIIYVLNIKMMYEKNVKFQIFISRQVNSESIAYDEKAFHFISHNMNMKKKARRYANAKIFACHLISVKTTMM